MQDLGRERRHEKDGEVVFRTQEKRDQGWKKAPDSPRRRDALTTDGHGDVDRGSPSSDLRRLGIEKVLCRCGGL